MNREFDDLRQTIDPIESVPDMPEDTHARWMQAVQATPQASAKPSAPWKRYIAAAAAAVFVIGGTALTRDQLPAAPSATQANGVVTYARTAAYDSAESPAAYGAPVAGAGALKSSGVNTAASMEETIGTDARKLIRTVDLTLGTRTYDASLTAITDACTAAGGWMENLSESSGTTRSAYMTLRIPAAALDDFLAGSDGWGRITHRNEYTQDVTESYQDTQARLETQQALMDRLQSLVNTAADLSDLLALEREISDTQYEIDRLTGILLRTDRQVDYATVSINLREESPLDEAENSDLSLWQRLSAGLATGFRFTVEWLGDIFVFLVSASPFLAIVGAAWLIVRLIRRRRK